MLLSYYYVTFSLYTLIYFSLFSCIFYEKLQSFDTSHTIKIPNHSKVEYKSLVKYLKKWPYHFLRVQDNTRTDQELIVLAL